jgi:CheY-like chemotaxis protein
MVKVSREDFIRVLYVDDDPDHLMIVKLYAEIFDPTVEVDSTTSPDEVVDRLDSYDCIVSDYQMPMINGLELAQKVREVSDIPFVLYPSMESEEVTEKAFSISIDDYVLKETESGHYHMLVKRVKMIVENHNAKERLSR